MLRRTFIATVLAITLSVSSGRIFAESPLQATILETKIISPQFELYGGWSTLGRRANGELWVVWSGGRESHVCPFGQVHAMTSKDNGKTWTWPRILKDGTIDDRDSGFLETSKGSLLVTTFSSLAYEPQLVKAENDKNWDAKRLAMWQAARDRLTADERKAELGTWMLRSTDGGTNWTAPYRVPVNSPHGPTNLNDGSIFYAGKQLWTDEKRIGAAISRDDGVTWEWLSHIPVREEDDERQYHELHAIQADSGRIIVQIRNHNKAHHHETLQTESDDGGKTWTVPHSIGVWGFPSHLLKLRDGRLLMTYGYRRAPLGNQVRISNDEGRTWSAPFILSGDGTSGDLGYPSTVELEDGSLLSVWYEKVKEHPRAVLRQAHWKLEPIKTP